MDEPKTLLSKLEAEIDQIIESEMDCVVAGGGALSLQSTGDLAQTDLAELVGKIFQQCFTGKLSLVRGEVEKSIYFEAGVPVMASSSQAEDRMLAMLEREGSITPEQRVDVERIVNATGRRAGAVLVDIGAISSDSLLPAIRRHYEDIILSMFSWNAGAFRLEPGVTAGSERTRLLRHPVELLLEAFEKQYSPEKLQAKIGPDGRMPSVEMDTSLIDLLACLGQEKWHLKVLVFFDGTRTIDDVHRLTGVGKGKIEQLIYLLSCFEKLGQGSASETGLRRDFGKSIDYDYEKKRLQAKLALANESDYFNLLGIKRDALPEEIPKAYLRQMKELTPAALGLELWQTEKEAVEVIGEVLAEALRVLGDRVLRVSYAFNVTYGPDAIDA